MLARRSVIFGSAAPALIAPIEKSFAKASQPSTRVNFEVPANACDCHAHIYGALKQFPLLPSRDYTPDTSVPSEMTRLHRALHIGRVVIVHPRPLGTDNSATIWGIKARGPNARGIALIDGNTPERELDRLDQLGFRGIRIDPRPFFPSNAEEGRRLFLTSARRLARLGWHLLLNVDLKTIAGLKDLVANSPVPVVVDHFAYTRGSLGLNQPGFGDLVDLVQSGSAYVKLSAPYRCSDLAPDYSDMAPVARSLIAANPDRILWGSDWPHPATPARNRVAGVTPGATSSARPVSEVTPHLAVDDGHVLNQLGIWAPDANIRRKILVENPARLYRFV